MPAPWIPAFAGMTGKEGGHDPGSGLAALAGFQPRAYGPKHAHELYTPFLMTVIPILPWKERNLVAEGSQLPVLKAMTGSRLGNGVPRRLTPSRNDSGAGRDSGKSCGATSPFSSF